jgi:hypothetical protein
MVSSEVLVARRELRSWAHEPRVSNTTAPRVAAFIPIARMEAVLVGRNLHR